MVKDLETPVGLETSSLASEAECICVASIEEVNDNAVCSEATRKAFESGGGCGCPLNCSQGCETSRRSSTAWLPREIPVILQRRNSSPENGQAAPLGGHCLGGQAKVTNPPNQTATQKTIIRVSFKGATWAPEGQSLKDVCSILRAMWEQRTVGVVIYNATIHSEA
eukprot:1195734-Prorocentrum_minimum.AAC.4